MDLRYSIDLESAHIIDSPVELDNLGITGAMRIMSGEPDSSILLQRMLDTGSYRMPQLASFLVDSMGVSVIEQWILSMGDTTMTDTTGSDTTSSDTTSADSTLTGLLYNSQQPKIFELELPYPNPFNASTKLRFSVPVSAHISLKILDIRGRQVDLLFRGNCSPGFYQFYWPSYRASLFESGVYLAVFSATPENKSRNRPIRISRKCLLMK